METSVENIQGFKGCVSFVGNLEACLPLIIAGEALRIGHHATQGMGSYRILDIGQHR
jgi:hypothetical protein